MSKEHIKKQLSSFSSVGMNDFLSNTSKRTFSLLKEAVIKNAEEEVVALILSALLGSIIERWEFPIHDRLSELCSVCKSDEKIQSSSNCIQHDNRNVYESYNESALGNTFSELSNHFITQTKSVDKKTQIMTSLSKESSNNEKLLQLPSIDEMEIPQQNITFMSLFEDEKEIIFGWSLLEMNSEVIIEFKQGNRYEGSLLRCRMHGRGKFFWAEGSTYEGEFSDGDMTGEGCLEWADQSRYEGEMLQGYRHGRGLYVQSPHVYCGEWACGRRHGSGSMFYDSRSTQQNCYDGEWSSDCKSGTGLRSYQSGAVYSGQWAAGLRHGLGTMVWLNNDVYIGNWEYGHIHGYGEYTWGTFFNNDLAVPPENCFYGNWDKGVRNGNGTMETSSGVVVRGTWKNGQKHGPAQVICSNGDSVYADDLFVEDCVSCLPVDRGVSHCTPTQLYHIPVNAANHDIDLTFYLDRLNNYLVECKRRGKLFKRPASPNQFEISMHTFSYQNDPKKLETTTESTVDCDVEEVLLRNIILQNLSALKMVYNKYSEMCCDVKLKGVSVLMRLMLWQLFRDCDLHRRGYSLADLDILIANNKATLVQGVYYPFERLWFWQFLHCLIELSWEFYGKHLIGTSSVPGILAAAVHKLITEDILPNAGRHKGKVLLKYKNLLSLDSVYWLYRGLGEPLSARKLLTNIFLTFEGRHDQQVNKNYKDNFIHGRNIIGVGGKLSYYQHSLLERQQVVDECTHPRSLSCLSSIGLVAVSDCLLDVCPSVASDGLIVNMDYKLVYLEFYEILLSCAQVQAKNKIQERKLAEVETVENTLQYQPDTIVQGNDVKVDKTIKSTTDKKTGKQKTKKK